MKSVLVVYYSQSGQVRRAVDSLTRPMISAPDISLEVVELQPLVPYPFPWLRITTFFGVLPETVLAEPGPNRPVPGFSGLKTAGGETQSADLVVLAYPVWFLMPAPPVQRFLSHDASHLVQHAPVVGLCVCRGMWYHASLAVKRTLQNLGCPSLLNIVVTHQGPQWATFLSVPRQLLFGSERSLCPGVPRPGISAADLSRLTAIGRLLRSALQAGDLSAMPPLSSAVPAERSAAILPELLAWPYFYGSALGLRCLGRHCRLLRKPAVMLFAAVLVLLIVIGLPVVALTGKLARALFPHWFERKKAAASVPYATKPG